MNENIDLNISTESTFNEEKKCFRRRNKKVSWADLIIYEFQNCLGDNPAVSSGCPLALDYNQCVSMSAFDIDYYEYARCQVYAPPRKGKQLRLKASERKSLLIYSGYSKNQITKAAEECGKIREGRLQNVIGTVESIEEHNLWTGGLGFLKKEKTWFNPISGLAMLNWFDSTTKISKVNARTA